MEMGLVLLEIENELNQLASLNEEQCKVFRKRIREALMERRKLPAGIRSRVVINKMFLSMIGQRDFSSIHSQGSIDNLKFVG
jgi:hypothetical protein